MKSGKVSHNLVSIANKDLAEKLDEVAQIKEKSQDSTPARSFKQDIWRAVYVLNILRYGLAITLLTLLTVPAIVSNWAPLDYLLFPRLFTGCAIVMLVSAIAFSYISKNKELRLSHLTAIQFSLDGLIVALMTYSTGSLESNFSLLYFVLVATGSVVLPRKYALGLGSGVFILMVFEYFYSILISSILITPNYPLLAKYGVLLLGIALVISYLAERLKKQEEKRYVPGDENIEEFLVRQEVNALKKALESTDGNKTEAAKLLGMSFRSFRYKLTKYDID